MCFSSVAADFFFVFFALCLLYYFHMLFTTFVVWVFGGITIEPFSTWILTYRIWLRICFNSGLNFVFWYDFYALVSCKDTGLDEDVVTKKSIFFQSFFFLKKFSFFSSPESNELKTAALSLHLKNKKKKEKKRKLNKKNNMIIFSYLLYQAAACKFQVYIEEDR